MKSPGTSDFSISPVVNPTSPVDFSIGPVVNPTSPVDFSIGPVVNPFSPVDFSISPALKALTPVDFSITAGESTPAKAGDYPFGSGFPRLGNWLFSSAPMVFCFPRKTFSPFGETGNDDTDASPCKVLKSRGSLRQALWRAACDYAPRVKKGGRYDQTTQKREDRKVCHAEVRERAPEYDGDGDSENDQNQEVTISLSEGESI